jgi:hypothetical protein
MEKKVLETALTSADDKVVAGYLGCSEKEVAVYKTRVRRKIANAEKFLREVRKYKSVLFPKKKYKGV